jgi:orotate phosphoribosyltransferase
MAPRDRVQPDTVSLAAGRPARVGLVTASDSHLVGDINACCRLSGTFTLRSGQVASEYFDKYLFESDPVLLGRVSDQMAGLLPRRTELLGGLELGGVPLATTISVRSGLPALFVRKQAKTYGTCKLAEGPPVDGRRVTLIEDGAVRAATLSLRAAGAVVDTVVCAIDRSTPGESPLADVGLEVRSVMTKAQLDAVSSQQRRPAGDATIPTP